MSARVRTRRSHVLVTRGGALAAATFLAGAGLLGVAPVGPAVAGASAVQVHYDVAPTAFPTFAESLQTLLNDMGMGDLNAVLGGFGAFTVDSPVSLFLAGLNPNDVTLGGVGDMFGISLTEPLYSANPAIESVLGTGSLFLVGGVPIGNVDLGELIDVVLGPGAGSHSLTELASVFNFDLNQNLPPLGPLGGVFSFFTGVSTYADAINKLGGTLSDFNEIWRGQGALGTYGPWVHDVLNGNSSLNDWLSGLLGVPTTDVTETTYRVLTTLGVSPSAYVFTGGSSPLGVGSNADPSQLDATTLGEYLGTLHVGGGTTGPTLDSATLGELFGLPPTQPWDEYLAGLPFGGNVFDHTGTLGDQTLGTLLSSFLPDGSTLVIDGDTPITEILEAFGLLNW